MKIPRIFHRFYANLVGYLRIPRIFHRFYAYLSGSFWLPCPLCDHYFGGHERFGSLMTGGWPTGKLVCANCIEEAIRTNERFMAENPLIPTEAEIRLEG